MATAATSCSEQPLCQPSHANKEWQKLAEATLPPAGKWPRGVKMRRVRTVIVAPNIEQIEAEGGLDDLLASILVQAEAAGIPVVFALSRKKLGQVS